MALTRGDHRACDHALGLQEEYLPCGIVEKDRAQLSITFGSSYKTSDCIVDALEAWWAALDEVEQVAMAKWDITIDNGPESRGKRTQVLQRMVVFCDGIDKPIPLLYDPPYPSKYNPIERCWGLLELHWNGDEVGAWRDHARVGEEHDLEGHGPTCRTQRKLSKKGVVLSKRAMQAVEARLARHPELPQWDILILPSAA